MLSVVPDSGVRRKDRLTQRLPVKMVLTLFACFLASPGYAFTFRTTAYPVGSNPMSVVTGDLDKDNDLDVVVANRGANAVVILLNDGNGDFTPTSSPIAVGSQPVSVSVGDLNGDTWLDIVTANLGDNTISVVLSMPGGTGYLSATSLTAGAWPTAVAIGNLDGDAFQDLVVTNQGQGVNPGGMSIFYGKGGGEFDPAVPLNEGIAPTSAPWSVHLKDISGDGLTDIAAVLNGTHRVLLRINSGGRIYQEPQSITVQQAPVAVVSGFLNGDALPDLAVVCQVSNDVTVLLSQPGSQGEYTGSFTAGGPYAVGSQPWDIAIGNFDFDGTPDLATASFTSRDVSILRGTGGGAFAPAESIASDRSLTGIVAAQLNNAGYDDLVVSALTDGFATVMINTTDLPTVVITHVGGVAVPARPGGSVLIPDLLVPPNADLSAVPVTVVTSSLPSTSQIRIMRGNELAGTVPIDAEGKATLTISLPLSPPDAASTIYTLLAETTIPSVVASLPVSVQVTRGIPGDLNADGLVTNLDVTRMMQLILGAGSAATSYELLVGDVRPKAGVNTAYGDGQLRANDLNWVIRRSMQLESDP